MAIVYSKVEQGKTITVCDSVPVHTGVNGDRSTDASTGILYTYSNGGWKSTSLPSVQSVVSSATVTPNADTDNEVIITAQAVGLTIANPTGTPVQGQALMIRVKDNATAQTIAFDTSYRAIGVTLPTTTVSSKTLYIGCIYNATDSKWDVLGINQEA